MSDLMAESIDLSGLWEIVRIETDSNNRPVMIIECISPEDSLDSKNNFLDGWDAWTASWVVPLPNYLDLSPGQVIAWQPNRQCWGVDYDHPITPELHEFLSQPPLTIEELEALDDPW